MSLQGLFKDLRHFLVDILPFLLGGYSAPGFPPAGSGGGSLSLTTVEYSNRPNLFRIGQNVKSASRFVLQVNVFRMMACKREFKLKSFRNSFKLFRVTSLEQLSVAEFSGE